MSTKSFDQRGIDDWQYSANTSEPGTWAAARQPSTAEAGRTELLGMQALTACPFCGRHDSVHVKKESDSECVVICDATHPNGPGGCGARSGYRQTVEKAVAAWNAREQAPRPN